VREHWRRKPLKSSSEVGAGLAIGLEVQKGGEGELVGVTIVSAK